ncbi:alpha/beta fold hydrolase [Nonomuraea sp. NPDC050394]|uniref:alpha/beta fold hydrolase n=1 Tax=Nonomuraea sp. NPDC050394 TaxID=3364363 RepID=UPI0037A5E9ED
MNIVTSADGTPIAYDRAGSGPAVILVGGALTSRAQGVGNNAPLAAELSARFTVYNYDRRGRGDSGDTRPYALEREIEDIEALVAEAGGTACLYGVSSGGGLVLEAAAAGVAVSRLAVYDVPYAVADHVYRRTSAYVDRLGPVLTAGRLGDALELFMRLAGSSEEEIEGAKASPYWTPLLPLAHTLAYDAAAVNHYRPPAGRLAKITRPALVATSGVSPDAQAGMGGLPSDFFDRAAEAIRASVPHAERRVLAGQSHAPDPAEVAAMLTSFFRD